MVSVSQLGNGTPNPAIFLFVYQWQRMFASRWRLWNGLHEARIKSTPHASRVSDILRAKPKFWNSQKNLISTYFCSDLTKFSPSVSKKKKKSAFAVTQIWKEMQGNFEVKIQKQKPALFNYNEILQGHCPSSALWINKKVRLQIKNFVFWTNFEMQ